jgi:hypothetical protein
MFGNFFYFREVFTGEFLNSLNENAGKKEWP